MLKLQTPSLLSRAGWLKQSVLAILGFAVCGYGAWSAAYSGASRVLADRGTRANLLSQTERGMQSAPTDAEAHYAQALVLSELGRQPEAVTELETAVALRPEDYYLWLELGRARDQLDDSAGARKAFSEAVRLAPDYAQPRWHLGNLLVREGDLDAGFAELRRAATSDVKFFPALIDLAWNAYEEDASVVLKIIQPATTEQRLAVAHFFISHDATTEAVKLLHRISGEIPLIERNALVSQILAAGKYQEAYEVWSAGREFARKDERDALTDGIFTSQPTSDEVGFGWQLPSATTGTRVELEKNERYAGSRSLRVEFKGDPYPATSPAIISQLALVQPGIRYRLQFSARVKDLASGSLPVVIVSEANDSKQAIAESSVLPRGTGDWQTYSVEFTTSSASRAVTIALRRQQCASLPCPIYGHAWLAAFSLRPISQN